MAIGPGNGAGPVPTPPRKGAGGRTGPAEASRRGQAANLGRPLPRFRAGDGPLAARTLLAGDHDG